jgi:hypothetical protein
MPSGGKGGGKGGGQATNADLQDDEDTMNRMYRRKQFSEFFKKKKRDEATAGVPINYSKSPAPPRRG